MNSEIRIESKFRKVHIELENLERKIYRKSGFLFFKSHIYTIEELMESPHHQKIFSITEKIGDDIENWFDAGKLTPKEESTYHTERDNIDEELHRIEMVIEDREPTWWEEIKGPIIEFNKRVLDNLPEEFRRNLIPFFKKILPTLKKLPKLLSMSEAKIRK
ncbi:MAG: hypothetical protein DRG30_09955 [Epsilonproteobacteria bacterium]|nr:MAG: hypothetical protein DRG30_09955 [Campylobacterota bacterium]